MLTTTPLDFLFSLERLGMKFGLENMRALCAALEHPERRFRSVIVAGTNGKGSVVAMVDTALRAAGYRSARYTSPHLQRLEERFVIDGREIDPETLRSAAARVQLTVERLLEDRVLQTPPTFFECTTALGFELFAQAGVDIAVLEVGLGGRLDATNIVSPVAAAITSIELDHQSLLGDSLESIAREKAGIIKPGIPVVCGAMSDRALEVIEGVCAEQGAHLVGVGRHIRFTVRTEGEHIRADFATAASVFDDVALALRGRHQAANAAVAVALLEQLQAIGIAVRPDAVRFALEHTDWPGRLERTQFRGTDVLLDAAHNPAGARALASFLADAGWRGATLVFGAMRDKDISGMLAALAPFCDRIVCTTPASPRAFTAEDVARVAAAYFGAGKVESVADPSAALERACEAARRVVVAGSIFLIGPLRGILR